MPTPASDSQPDQTVLELTVKAHPGVMSQVCGLLARRVYPVHGFLYLPRTGTPYGRIWLQVQDDHRVPTMLKQLRKLEDVIAVCLRAAPHPMFTQLDVGVQERG